MLVYRNLHVLLDIFKNTVARACWPGHEDHDPDARLTQALRHEWF
jgi:hypothetical protein